MGSAINNCVRKQRRAPLVGSIVFQNDCKRCKKDKKKPKIDRGAPLPASSEPIATPPPPPVAVNPPVEPVLPAPVIPSVSEFRQILDEHTRHIDSKIDGLANAQNNLGAAFLNIQERVGEMGKSLDGVHEGIGSINKRVDALDGQIDGITKRLQDLESRAENQHQHHHQHNPHGIIFSYPDCCCESTHPLDPFMPSPKNVKFRKH